MATTEQGSLWESGRDPDLDLDLKAVRAWFLGQPNYRDKFADAVRSAFDDAINPFATGRVAVADLNKPEKTVIGTNVERRIREAFDLPDGNVLDYLVARSDVDCKFSLFRGRWMIPPEAIGRLLLVVWADESSRHLQVGLIRASEEVLSSGKNQDSKRQLSALGAKKIEWLVNGRVLPENRLLRLGKDEREAVLGDTAGARRARELFIRCEGLVINAHDVGDSLSAVGYAFLDGNISADRQRAHTLGGPVPRPGEWLCLRIPEGSAE